MVVVKSVSVGSSPPSAAFSHEQASNINVNSEACARVVENIGLLAARCPQAQVAPETLEFSVAARSHVHSPAGRAPKSLCVSILCTTSHNWCSATARYRVWRPCQSEKNILTA